MGLEDDFIIQLRDKIALGKPLLDENYDILAAIYRLKHGDNQLEFQWDGRSHMEKYDEEWKAMYYQWIETLSGIREINRSVVKFATQGDGFNNEFLINAIRRSIASHFNLKVRAQRLYKASA